MTLTVVLPPDEEAELLARAHAQGVAPNALVRDAIKRLLADVPAAPNISSASAEDYARREEAGRQIRELRQGNRLAGLSLRGLVNEGRRV